MIGTLPFRNSQCSLGVLQMKRHSIWDLKDSEAQILRDLRASLDVRTTSEMECNGHQPEKNRKLLASLPLVTSDAQTRMLETIRSISNAISAMMEETECTTRHLSKYAQAQSREYHRLRYNFFRLPLADHFCNLQENSE